mmetsp:Transcript_12465/g.39400  ORF Transcript_12465/g.39400 Transcript_12465/m.39400 type:complete len:296 (+) Transcript_12465:2333-3220(+)
MSATVSLFVSRVDRRSTGPPAPPSRSSASLRRCASAMDFLICSFSSSSSSSSESSKVKETSPYFLPAVVMNFTPSAVTMTVSASSTEKVLSLPSATGTPSSAILATNVMPSAHSNFSFDAEINSSGVDTACNPMPAPQSVVMYWARSPRASCAAAYAAASVTPGRMASVSAVCAFVTDSYTFLCTSFGSTKSVRATVAKYPVYRTSSCSAMGPTVSGFSSASPATRGRRRSDLPDATRGGVTISIIARSEPLGILSLRNLFSSAMKSSTCRATVACETALVSVRALSIAPMTAFW